MSGLWCCTALRILCSGRQGALAAGGPCPRLLPCNQCPQANLPRAAANMHAVLIVSIQRVIAANSKQGHCLECCWQGLSSRRCTERSGCTTHLGPIAMQLVKQCAPFPASAHAHALRQTKGFTVSRTRLPTPITQYCVACCMHGSRVFCHATTKDCCCEHVQGRQANALPLNFMMDNGGKAQNTHFFAFDLVDNTASQETYNHECLCVF